MVVPFVGELEGDTRFFQQVVDDLTPLDLASRSEVELEKYK